VALEPARQRVTWLSFPMALCGVSMQGVANF